MLHTDKQVLCVRTHTTSPQLAKKIVNAQYLLNRFLRDVNSQKKTCPQVHARLIWGLQNQVKYQHTHYLLCLGLQGLKVIGDVFQLLLQFSTFTGFEGRSPLSLFQENKERWHRGWRGRSIVKKEGKSSSVKTSAIWFKIMRARDDRQSWQCGIDTVVREHEERVPYDREKAWG